MTVLDYNQVKWQLPRMMERILTSRARIVVVIGGRSSGKSEGIGRIVLIKADSEGADVLCGREYQNSIDDSVHKLLKGLIDDHCLVGVDVTDKKIDFDNGAEIRFKGFARNSSAVRSAHSFKYSWIEEAQDLSENSIEELLPTIRAAGSQLLFSANPMASNDPFSKRFITPFKKHIDRYGFYEDEMHLIIKMNWRDNPWHGELETQRLWDKAHMSRAKYDHIWEGEFNDTVEDAIIQAEWFDAAIDAHLKLGFKPRGAIVLAHDPSDTGPDNKGICLRHGSVILDVQEKPDGDANEGCDWALDYAIGHNIDLFVWDCDGLGVSLKRQIVDALEGKRIKYQMFKGSESPLNPEQFYMPDERVGWENSRKNKDTFRNKRAQYYWMLRDRFYNAYRAVEKKEYVNPDEMISISSEIDCLTQFRSEICRIPRKANGNGFIQIMTKQEMKTRLKIESPNLADSAMMCLHMPVIREQIDNRPIYIPDLKRL